MESMDHCYYGSVHSSLPADKELSSMVIILTGAMYLKVFLRDPFWVLFCSSCISMIFPL